MNLKTAVLTCALAGAAISAPAQIAVPPLSAAYQPLSEAQLDQLLGSIALYPDPLIAEVLPASTLPAQIVLANRYVSGGGDPTQVDRQPWDASVQALARYPNVLKWMDDNLTWTTQAGQAFLAQQPAVMASIQRLRASASRFGNLQSTPQQQVISDPAGIEIVPADPQVIYVPVYQPSDVYYQTAGISPFITFGAGFAVGGWLNYDLDWGNDNLIMWNHEHPRPSNWWREGPRRRDSGRASVWRPANRAGTSAPRSGDRGWGGANTVVRSAAPAAPARPSAQRGAVVAPRAAPRASAVRSQPTGALSGIQSARQTRAYSARGQQSIQSARPAPAARPASGGGSRNNSNSQKKR